MCWYMLCVPLEMGSSKVRDSGLCFLYVFVNQCFVVAQKGLDIGGV